MHPEPGNGLTLLGGMKRFVTNKPEDEGGGERYHAHDNKGPTEAAIGAYVSIYVSVWHLCHHSNFTGRRLSCLDLINGRGHEPILTPRFLQMARTLLSPGGNSAPTPSSPTGPRRAIHHEQGQSRRHLRITSGTERCRLTVTHDQRPTPRKPTTSSTAAGQ